MKSRATILFACFLGLAFFALPNARAQSTLYGTTGGPFPGALYTIDPSTGAATLVGPLVDSSANTYSVTGLAFDSLTGILYGSTGTASPTGASELVAINTSSGLVTPIGSFGVTGTMADLTFNSVNNTLYGTNSLSADLYTISLSTGAAITLGPSGVAGVPRGVGVAANDSGTIYGTPNGASGIGGQLVIYSTADGSTTVVNSLSGATYPVGAINALAVNSSGTLLGVNVDLTNPARPTALVSIDTTTGVVTLIGLSIDGLDALAFSPMVAVPEASTWAAAALAVAYVLFLRFRRKKTTATLPS